MVQTCINSVHYKERCLADRDQPGFEIYSSRSYKQPILKLEYLPTILEKIIVDSVCKNTNTCLAQTYMQKQHFLTVEKLLDRLGESSVTDGGDEDANMCM